MRNRIHSWQQTEAKSEGRAVLGAFSAAWTADAFGRKPALALLLSVKFISITLEVVATTNAVYFAALLLGGLCWGGFSGVVMTYVSEIAPLRLRGVLTAAVPIAFSFGSFIVSILIKCTGERNSRWAYRSTFVSQYGLAGVAVIVLPFMPESPWWLTTSGKHHQAIAALRCLSYSEAEANAQTEDMLRTLANGKDETAGATYIECFRKSNLRRTIISIMPMSIQALSGVSFVGFYSTYYQQLAGYSTETSFYLFIVQVVLSMLGIICSLFLIDRVGRRDLTIWGMSFLTVSLVVTGGLAAAGTPGTVKGTVALLLLYCYVYNLTIGATAFSLSAEIATARLRAKTASLTFALQGALFSMWGLVLPYLFNPDKANLGAKVTFIFGGLSVLSTIYLWFYQPEVAGRSYEELDEMFRRRVPARKFKTYQLGNGVGDV